MTGNISEQLQRRVHFKKVKAMTDKIENAYRKIVGVPDRGIVKDVAKHLRDKGYDDDQVLAPGFDIDKIIREVFK